MEDLAVTRLSVIGHGHELVCCCKPFAKKLTATSATGLHKAAHVEVEIEIF